MDRATRELMLAYLQKAEKKLSVAKKLFLDGEYEDAVSRAYYSAFLATQALLLTEGHKAESHKGAITLFSLLFVKTGKFEKNYGKFLINLKDDREISDYEVFSYIDRETSETALREAEEFLLKTKKYLKEIKVLTD